MDDRATSGIRCSCGWQVDHAGPDAAQWNRAAHKIHLAAGIPVDDRLDGIERHAAFLARARYLSSAIQRLSVAGMHGDRLLQVNRLWNELHELIELGEVDNDG